MCVGDVLGFVNHLFVCVELIYYPVICRILLQDAVSLHDHFMLQMYY